MPPRLDPDLTVTQPLLDRLIDKDPKKHTGDTLLLAANAAAGNTGEVTAAPASLTFGYLRSNSFPISASLTVTNKGAAGIKLASSMVEYIPSAASMVADPSSLWLEPGASASLKVTISGAFPAPGEYSGFVSLTGVDTRVRTPYSYLVGVNRRESVRQLKAALRRDLEWLLNTRRIPDAAPDSMKQLSQSLYNYGLPDFSALSVNSPRDRDRLLLELENTVALFEPRLRDVRISMTEVQGGYTRILHFQIEGMLQMDPVSEPVSFDTVLQLTNGEYQVRGDRGA